MKRSLALSLALLGSCRVPVRLSEPEEARAAHAPRRGTHDPEPERARVARRALSHLPSVLRPDRDALEQITTSLAPLCVRLDSDADPSHARFQCEYDVAAANAHDRVGTLRYRSGRWALADADVTGILRAAGATLGSFRQVHLIVAGFVDCLPVRGPLPSCTDRSFLDPGALTGELAACAHPERLRAHDPMLNRCLAWCRAAGVARALLGDQAPAETVSVAIVGGDTAWAGLCASAGGGTIPPGRCTEHPHGCNLARKVELVLSLEPAETSERVGCEGSPPSPQGALACLEESYARRNAFLVSFRGDGGTPASPATLPSSPLIHRIGRAPLPPEEVLRLLNLRPPVGSP